MIDDNRKFLNNIKLDLDPKRAIFQFYDNPVKALQFLTEKYTPDPFINRCIQHPEERHRDHRNIDVDIRAIHKELYNPMRFNEISVIVVDYAMPGLNGLEFCERLKSRQFKMILLTGEADEKLANDAFNRGIIHRFIRKDTLNFVEVLKSAINELQLMYFQDLSEIIINSLTKNPDYPYCCLDDQVFINFFEMLCNKNQFTEYYLMDATGSYLFLDFEGKPTWLAVKDENWMESDAFTAEMSDTEISPEILEPLRKREKLLYLHSDDDFDKQPQDWLPYLHPAQKLIGRSIYYYAYINDPKVYDIHSDRILSYKEYLAKAH
jgi:CheY-like chemotaxis protein